ncbi:hypothetical protein ACFFHM_12425 [Halalkalibacter kiskunsagensis]|uniref:Uncharacterized protein n=1 Tax=Halalkalibacter kiskunsagensis TaxID=1548599 RepID=A0ABV6KDD5_9BACI
MISKQLDWWDHMFKVREAYVSQGTIPCAMHGTVCEMNCKSCTWLKEIKIENEQSKVICQPPVIWEQ